MCQDVHTSKQLCEELTKEPRLVYKTTNYKPDYSNDCDYGLLIQTDTVMSAISSYLKLFRFKLSTVFSFFDVWSLGDKLSCSYLYISDNFYINESGEYHNHYFFT
jgi:hypothetical protein